MASFLLSESDIDAAGGDSTEALRRLRKNGVEEYDETSHMPVWAANLTGIGANRKKDMGGFDRRKRKFASAADFLEKGLSYFDYCVDKLTPPTKIGLALWLGFVDFGRLTIYVKKNPDMVWVFNHLMSLVTMTLEHVAMTPEGHNANNAWKILVNTPSGYSGDPRSTPLTYEYKDKSQVEISGNNGGPLAITVDDKTATELWVQFRNAGAKLKKDE